MLLLAAILTCSDLFDVFYTQGYTRLIIQNGSLVVGWTGDLVSLLSIRAVLVDVWREEVTSPPPTLGMYHAWKWESWRASDVVTREVDQPQSCPKVPCSFTVDDGGNRRIFRSLEGREEGRDREREGIVVSPWKINKVLASLPLDIWRTRHTEQQEQQEQ